MQDTIIRYLNYEKIIFVWNSLFSVIKIVSMWSNTVFYILYVRIIYSLGK